MKFRVLAVVTLEVENIRNKIFKEVSKVYPVDRPHYTASSPSPTFRPGRPHVHQIHRLPLISGREGGLSQAVVWSDLVCIRTSPQEQRPYYAELR